MRTNSAVWTQPAIILAGSLRSGTTLLRLMLAQHPQLASDHEYDFLLDVLDPDGTPPTATVLHQRLRRQRIFKQMNYRLEKTATYTDLLESVLGNLGRNDTVPVLSIHRHFTHATRVFPKAKFIHLVRDPRDVARSSKNMGWSGNMYYACQHWIDTETQWEQSAADIHPHRQLTVSYEELVRESQHTLREICQFLEIDFNISMVDGYAQHSTYMAPDATLAEQWKTKMSDEDIALVEARTRGLLEVRGYKRSQPLTRTSVLKRVALRIDHSVGRTLFSIDRFGTALVLQEKLGRWLGLRRWHMSVLDRIHHIENQFDR